MKKYTKFPFDFTYSKEGGRRFIEHDNISIPCHKVKMVKEDNGYSIYIISIVDMSEVCYLAADGLKRWFAEVSLKSLASDFWLEIV